MVLDAALSTFVKPIVGIVDFVRIVLALVICILPIIFRYISKGKRTFTRLDELHTFLSSLPGGRYLFNRFFLWLNTTYTETMRPNVTKVSQTEACVYIDDNVWIRNPFGSIHAAALANLAELTTAMAVLCATQHRKGVRAIPTRIDVEYLKKARGRITGTTKINLPTVSGPYQSIAEMKNSKGEVVSKGTVSWHVSIKDS